MAVMARALAGCRLGAGVDDDPAAAKQIFARLSATYARVSDPIVQVAFVRDAALGLHLDEAETRKRLEFYARALAAARKRSGAGEEPDPREPLELAAEGLLAAVLRSEAAVAEARGQEGLAELLPSGERRELYRAVVERGENPRTLQDAGASALASRLLASTPVSEYPAAAYIAQVRKLARRSARRGRP